MTVMHGAIELHPEDLACNVEIEFKTTSHSALIVGRTAAPLRQNHRTS